MRSNIPIISLFLCIFLLGITQQSSLAQNRLTLYNMPTVPQSSYLNPAHSPLYNIYVGLPLISSIELQLNSTVPLGTPYIGSLFAGLNENADFRQLLTDDIDNLIELAKTDNRLYSHLEYDLLSFGFRQRKLFLNFSAKENMSLQMNYPKSFLEFTKDGILQADSTATGVRAYELNDLNLYAQHIRSFEFGAAYDINRQLTVGAKVKYLQGNFNFWSGINGVGNDLKANVTDNGRIVLTGTPDINSASVSDYLSGERDFSLKNLGFLLNAFNNANSGLAFDIGATYLLMDNLILSASLTDMGGIKWQDSLSIVNEAYSNTFTSPSELGSFIPDLLEDNESTDATLSYRSPLITRFNLGGNYYLNKNNNVSLLFQFAFPPENVTTGLNIGYNTQPADWLGFSVNYALYNGRSHIGTGVSINLGALQLYMITDNIGVVTSLNSTRSFNTRVGLNLTFGRRNPVIKIDGNSGRKLPGGKEQFSRKDWDGDGVENKYDQCPEEAGDKFFNGCPDSDFDGIPDREDQCPDEAGKLSAQGCPSGEPMTDRSLDELHPPVRSKNTPSNNNSTKRVTGTTKPKTSSKPPAPLEPQSSEPDPQPAPKTSSKPKKSKKPKLEPGQVDSDKDGIPDDKDKCPYAKGGTDFEGCPDSDKDGVPDHLDQCPTKKGSTATQGC